MIEKKFRCCFYVSLICVFNYTPGQSIQIQPPEIETMVGIYGHSIDLTSDGGFIVAGYIKYQSRGFRDHDLWILKADSAGREEWHRTFGGKSTDRGYSVRQTADGGYIVAGETHSFGNGYQFLLIKTDAHGNDEWHRTFGGSGTDRAYELDITSDGGFILAGFTDSKGQGKDDFLIIKLDSHGSVEWNQKYGGKGIDRAYSIRQEKNGGYVVLGNTDSKGAGKSDIWLVRLDSDGTAVWDTTFGGALADEGRCVRQASDGGFFISGTVYDETLHRGDLAVMKLDEKGSLQWQQVLGGPVTEKGERLIETADGGVAVVGYTDSYGAGYADVWLVKLDRDGKMRWAETFGGATTDWGYDIKQAADGGFLISGISKSTGYRATDVWIICTDAEGYKKWDRVFREPEPD